MLAIRSLRRPPFLALLLPWGRVALVALAALSLSACGEGEDDTIERTTLRGLHAPIPANQPRVVAPTAAEPGAEAPAEAAPREGEPPEIERPYEDGLDAQPLVTAALAAGADDGKRVLLVFGANWCHWCRRLDWVFENEPRVSSALEADYRVIHVDVGASGDNPNAALTERYGNPQSNGLPCLVVLDAEGELEHTQETGALEDGDRHDPAAILAFLARFANRG